MLEEFDEPSISATVGSDTERPEAADSSNDIKVEITDATSEKEQVNFTIKTVTSLLPRFSKPEFTSIRTHEEFVWLGDRLSENPDYAGLVIPPVPPAPDFTASRDKLAKLSDGEATMSKDEYEKIKSELEAEYLATFKKTVAMHEAFLRRIAEHEQLREDNIFKVFLEYDGDLNVRHKNKKEKVQGFLRNGWKSVDDALLANHKEKDEFFEAQRHFITTYFTQLKSVMHHSNRMNKTHKATADAYIGISSNCHDMFAIERNKSLADFLHRFGEFSENYRKLEGRLASDSDLKLTDSLQYYVADCYSAKDLLYRRSRSLADYEDANKELDKARNRCKEVQRAEQDQEKKFNYFNHISESARSELADFKQRWVNYFHSSLTELTKLQIKHCKAQVNMLTETIEKLQGMNG